jgi:hypothetical protein
MNQCEFIERNDGAPVDLDEMARRIVSDIKAETLLVISARNYLKAKQSLLDQMAWDNLNLG